MQKQKLLFLIPILFVHFLNFAAQDPALQKLKDRVERATATQMAQIIQGAMVTAFSKDSLIRGGLEPKDIKSWEDLTSVANELVDDAVKNEQRKNFYKEDVKALRLVYLLLKGAIDKLHNQYAQYYFKDGDKVKLNLGNKKLDDAAQAELKYILGELVEYQPQLRSINEKTFKVIVQDVPTPERWSKELYENGKIIDANEVFKAYDKEKIFKKNYKELLKQYKDNKDFQLFMRKKGVINQRSAENLYDALEKMAYIMQQKLNEYEKSSAPQKAWNKSSNAERKENLEVILEILIKLRNMYPAMSPTLDALKFNSTADKISMILFVQSGALESVLNQFKREVQELLDASK